MRKELTELRKKMKENGIDIYIVPTADPHGSEYVNEHFKCREYVSGFTGSAGTLVVKSEWAGLWTDGRYFIQAEKQLDRSGIELMKMGEEDVPDMEEYLDVQDRNAVIGFDGRVISQELGNSLAQRFSIRYDIDLVGEIWKERPELIPTEIRQISLKAAGESTQSKLERIRKAIGDTDYILLSSLEEIAWLYNLRANDIKHTPVFYSFALISKSVDILYVMDEVLTENKVFEDSQHCVRRYEQLYYDLTELKDCTVLLDKRTVSYSIFKSLHSSVKPIVDRCPVELFKSVKNKTEIEATRKAHIRDGAAVTEFIYWLKSNVGRIRITEKTAADYLEECRRKYGAYDLSFETIAGYEENGAIIHYAVTDETDKELRPEGFLLVDSGGQYEGGTTDITRTIALGTVDDERKLHYTAVLKGHIALALSQFTDTTGGDELDAAARKPLQELGFDYNHGTGHGVGHMLSVHEGPNTISRRGKDSHILPGMITSNEPGIYLEERYGIRLENELLCIKKGDMYAFETITFCPFERDAIMIDMLNEAELQYLNSYHKQVYEVLEPFFQEDLKKWFKEACMNL